nr:GNAT family N-acetyltransferase [Salinispora cortesiana]
MAAEAQGRGYGRFAVDAVCQEVRARRGDRAYVTWEPGAGGPAGFYLRLGFRPTGEESGGQTVGVRSLSGRGQDAARPAVDPSARSEALHP